MNYESMTKYFSAVCVDENGDNTTWYESCDLLWLLQQVASVNGVYYKWQIKNNKLWVWGDKQHTWKWEIVTS